MNSKCMYCEEGEHCKMCEAGKECDHIVGEWCDSAPGVYLVKKSEPYLVTDGGFEPFKYCPLCGEKL